ncbi:MAG TPA: hypothetical protein VHX67_10535 [Acidimicrobiales bacterium]|jgi:hypothetical protein|nr:hypothetical protein [Acidimicrobiales bacterium]
MGDLIWSFSPWLLFLLATRFTSLSGAIALGLVAALVVAARAIGHHRLHLLDVASVLYFTGLGLALEIIQPVSVTYWSRYAQAGAHAFLTLIVLGSVAIGRPFTESYAKETVPKEVWGTPQFRAVNRSISLVWGLAFLLGTISLIVAGSVTGRPFLLRILIPFGALAWAYSYTQRVITARRAGAAGAAGGAAPGTGPGGGAEPATPPA